MSRRPRPGAVLALVAVLVAAAGLLVTAALRDTLIYYRTPAEVATAPPATGERVRLAGRVVAGSVRQDGALLRFRLTDGAREVPVVQRGAPPDTFREGREAVVDGVFDAGGVLHSDSVAVKHSNEYRAATPSPAPGAGR